MGPPHTIVQVQAILYASLAASLFSAFLAMLGKQWLNQYASTELRGTTIEHSQNRQRKLDGITTWYFDYVMGSLPLMLQVALFLLGCALSRYLWEINITVASVVIGATSAGIFFYIAIVIAGTASKSCPYQTPGSNALCYLWPRVQRVFYLALRNSKTIRVAQELMQYYYPQWPRGGVAPFLGYMALCIPCGVLVDIYCLGKGVTLQLAILLVSLGCRVHNWLCNTTPTSEQELDQQTAMLELRCILWMLRTSLDKNVLLSILKHLATMVTLAKFDPTLVMDCFNTFLGCIKVDTKNHRVVIVQGLEQLATTSALCVLNTISHLLVMDPTSSVIEDVHQCYIKVLSAPVNFHGHQFYHTMNAICCLFVQSQERRGFPWSDYKPSANEHAIVAHNLVKVAQFGYQRVQQTKVPRWILRFAFHSLSLDPSLPKPIVADCLLIIAIELGCGVPSTGTTAPDQRCVYFPGIITILTPHQCPGGGSSEPDNSEAQNSS